jgi:CspA family cold shock protein
VCRLLSQGRTHGPPRGRAARGADEEPEDDVENYDIPTEPYSQEQPKAPSPNRPADYRSGDEHPLAGRGGERFTGHVKWFNDRKGFGFITLDNGVEIFVHYSGIISEGYKTLKQNQRVEIAVEDTGKGPQAAQVTVLQDEPDAEAVDEDQLTEAAD